MKTRKDVLLWVRTIVKKYRDQGFVDPKALDKELVEYAKPCDVGYGGDREEAKAELSKYHDPRYELLAKALIKCVDLHPEIRGAFVTGSHANSETASLNNAVVTLISDAASLIGIITEHPEFDI